MSGLCTVESGREIKFGNTEQDRGSMDEQQELSLKVEHVSLKGIQKGPMYIGRQILHHNEQQAPIVWCGGLAVECHDVTIYLVPNGINWKMSEEAEHYREILAVLKVHSSRLRKCSKYFETCLAERWGRPSSTLFLETNTDIAFYTDCFSRMYATTFRKNFKDIKSSLGLLKVASQIQFHELMDSALLFISSKVWSDTDEAMIKLYATSPDFPRNHAQDLVVRLGMDVKTEDCHEQLYDVVEQCVRSALGHDGNFLSHRALIKDLLPGSALNMNGSSGGPSADSYIKRDVIMIFIKEAKDMLVNVGQEFDGQTYVSVPRFANKILAVCWMLETLLAANVAEEVVECFVHLHALPKIIAIDSAPPPRYGYEQQREHDARLKVQNDATKAAAELAKLVLMMYREVANGNLLLKTPERAALLENWHSVFGKFWNTRDSFDQAIRDLFSTLPLKKQMELFKARKDSNYEDYISRGSLANLLKRNWPATEEKCVVSPPSSS